jgi:hypothetical protein
MLFLPINREWLLSQAAQRIYLGCAVLTFALVATITGTHLAISAAGASALSADARSVVRTILFPEILGTALLWVSMWYFWFGLDRSHYLKKAFSFVLLFFFAPIGTVVYYFVSYRRQVVAMRAADQTA